MEDGLSYREIDQEGQLILIKNMKKDLEAFKENSGMV